MGGSRGKVKKERFADGMAGRVRYRGTFTDVALIEEETSRIAIAKVPTTPQDFAKGVTAGLHQGLARYSIEPAADRSSPTQQPSSPTRCSRRRAPESHL